MPVRVVIAEDEAIIRLDLKEILEDEGYEIVGETGRGDEAVDLVRKHHPDLAILDIKMPGMDGLTAAKEITGERLAAVLILTAFSQRELIPQMEIALGRFKEMKVLAQQVESLEDQLEIRKLVERAKGMLMDELSLKEAAAFDWIQKTAMRERLTMKEIARRVIEDGLRPESP